MQRICKLNSMYKLNRMTKFAFAAQKGFTTKIVNNPSQNAKSRCVVQHLVETSKFCVRWIKTHHVAIHIAIRCWLHNFPNKQTQNRPPHQRKKTQHLINRDEPHHCPFKHVWATPAQRRAKPIGSREVCATFVRKQANVRNNRAKLRPTCATFVRAKLSRMQLTFWHRYIWQNHWQCSWAMLLHIKIQPKFTNFMKQSRAK